MSLLARLEAAETAHLGLYACEPVGWVAHFGPVRAVYAGPDLPVNVASGLGDTPDPALEQIETFYAGLGLPARLVAYSELPSAALERLAGRDYSLTRLLHAHARTLDTPPPPPTLPVTELDPASWAELAARAFGPGNEAIMALTAKRPRTQLYAAWREGQPVAVGALSVLDGVALLFSAATLPGQRGRGAQGALLAARLRDAQAAGADIACVLTAPGSASERNVRRFGFEQVGARLSFERACQDSATTRSG